MARRLGRILPQKGGDVLQAEIAAVADPRRRGEDGAASNAATDRGGSFERAYEAEFPRVYGYVRYCIGNRDTADDLTSQAFLKALDKLPTFDPSRADIGPWILGIARNVVRDHLRARRRWRWLPFDWLAERPSSQPSPEEAAAASEERRRVLEALAALPDRDRDVLGLKFAAGLTNQEIARLTRLGESHVGVIVYRAIRKLRARMGGGEAGRG
jgi:RNA polymerase sigma-70 factor (ECF subfamily)